MPECLETSPVTFRNFNVCPHCRAIGDQPLLNRLSEGLPMISRSDGSSFHLLLADRPLPYPNELSAGPTNTISVCFWHSHISEPRITHSTIVTLRSKETNRPQVFRMIESVADALADELARCGRLCQFYDLTTDSLFAMPA